MQQKKDKPDKINTYSGAHNPIQLTESYGIIQIAAREECIVIAPENENWASIERLYNYLRNNNEATVIACYIDYVTQAVVNAFVPLLSLAGCALVGFSVGVFRPGTLSLAAQKMHGGSTAMYALLLTRMGAGLDKG